MHVPFPIPIKFMRLVYIYHAFCLMDYIYTIPMDPSWDMNFTDTSLPAHALCGSLAFKDRYLWKPTESYNPLTQLKVENGSQSLVGMMCGVRMCLFCFLFGCVNIISTIDRIPLTPKEVCTDWGFIIGRQKGIRNVAKILTIPNDITVESEDDTRRSDPVRRRSSRCWRTAVRIGAVSGSPEGRYGFGFLKKHGKSRGLKC